jgi:hypothetical protein
MRTQIDESDTGPPPTPEEILRDFCFEADMAFFEDNLHELLMEFIASESGCERTDKDNIIYTYEVLRRLIRRVKVIQNQLRPQK